MLIPLTDCKTAGQKVRVMTITSCCKMRHRLIEMGLSPGREVEVIRPCCKTGITVKVAGSRICLGTDLAAKVLVAS